MSKAKRFFRTEIRFVVLSERRVDQDDLASLILECNAGDMVGKESERKVSELTASSIREELVDAGSEPGFFGLDLGTTDSSRISWLEGLSSGDRVQWNDPDDGICSGRGAVTSIESDSGDIENTDTIINLMMDDGGSVEVTCREIDKIDDPREDFLSNLWRNDQVTVEGKVCVLMDSVLSTGNPRQWVWKVAPINEQGQIIGPSFEANGDEFT